MRLLLTFLAVMVFLGSLGFASVMGLYAYFARDLPDPGTLSRRQLFQTAHILDRNGKLLQELNDPSGGRRILVHLSDIPKVMRDATIAAEDASFYDNPGFDVRAVIRATYQWIRSGSPQSGASTITQQLVKNTLLGPEQTAERKIKEAFLAMELTRRYTKDQILEMYMNEILYGNRAYGVEAAAETYFGKPAKDLSLAEASLLAGLPQAPSYYDPYTNLPGARERQSYVLDQMVHTAPSLPRSRTPRLARRTARASQPGRPAGSAPLRDLRPPAGRRPLRDRGAVREGLRITTSLDLDLQHLAETSASDHIADIKARNATNAALVAIQPSTGEVMAMLGSVNFDDPSIDGQVNVALALRQPGSTLKPFTYVTAFGKGWNPATMMWDIPTTFPGGYKPNDFDNKFPGPMTVRDALAQSRNIPAVEALQFVGVPDMLATAHRFGINDLRQPERYGLSVTLGGGEVKLLDLTYAYSVFANGGQQTGADVPSDVREQGFRQFNPVSILKVTNSSGKVLFEYKPNEHAEVEDPRLTYQITSILSDDKARQPTYGANSPLVLPGRPAAVKTGTTDEYRDSWVVGYTPDLVTGVWVGNSDNSPMKDILGVAGAGQIWHDFMAGALAGVPVIQFQPPQGVQQAEVCALSGMLPTQECRENTLPIHGIRQEWFVPGINLPTKPDDWHQSIDVCKVNGKRSTPLVPDNARDSLVYVTLPEAARAWGARPRVSQPAERRIAATSIRASASPQIGGPAETDRITVGQTVQIVGSAYVDDFSNYTLDVGQVTTPPRGRPLPISAPRRSTKRYLGYGTRTGLPPGRYRLRPRL